VQQPALLRQLHTAKLHTAKLHSVQPIGINLDAGEPTSAKPNRPKAEQTIAQRRPSFVCTVPTLQNLTDHAMNLPRRRARI
jgi:DNA-binding transcriptional MocR family regulator